MKKYYPYKSDKDGKKFYIITNENKKVYFGAAGYEDFTTHKDEARKQRYKARHKNEDWDDINSAAFWSRFYLWEKPTKKEAYENIKKKIYKLIYFFKKNI
jgi:uncharacterized pyridoxamine 5'-phosphate oxidase family protein